MNCLRRKLPFILLLGIKTLSAQSNDSFEATGHAILNAPADYDSWVMTTSCQQALDLYRQSGKLETGGIIPTPKDAVVYDQGQAATVIEIAACAKIIIVEAEGGVGFVAAELVGITPAQLKKAQAESRHLAAYRVASAKAKAERLAAIAKLPTLNSGLVSVFIASDKKCSEQFLQALSMDGLEKRKKLVDLVNYSCGFIEKPGVHVTRTETQGQFCAISVADGKRTNESGWVPCIWIKGDLK